MPQKGPRRDEMAHFHQYFKCNPGKLDWIPLSSAEIDTHPITIYLITNRDYNFGTSGERGSGGQYGGQRTHFQQYLKYNATKLI